MTRVPVALVVVAAIGLAGCERVARGMYQQPRYDRDERSTLFPDDRATRPPPPGSVPHAAGDLAATSSGRRGEQAVLDAVQAEAAQGPPPLTTALLQRGRERYGIYCLPCHSALGDGDGPVVRRGFPAPPSYHQPRLREASDRHLYDVISAGHGVMPAYGDRVVPADRWAIVAYVRALQLSQHAPLHDLPPALQARLDALPRPAPPAQAHR